MLARSDLTDARGIEADLVSVPGDTFEFPPVAKLGMPSVLDLFAGAGGFSLGFECAGAFVKAAVEIDKWACETLQANHHHTNVVQKNIVELSDDELFAIGKGVDVIIGGPPCQGYSVANRQAGDANDPRNSLFREFVRAVEICKPRAVLMENVPGLLKRKTGTGELVIDVICSELRRLGYVAHVRILQAMDFGVPQIRPRLFVLGLRASANTPFPSATHNDESKTGQTFFSERAGRRYVNLWEAISDLPQIHAREGQEVAEYANGPENAYQSLLRANSKNLFNHTAMRHSPRLVERFSKLVWGQSGADAPQEHGARKRGKPEELSNKSFDQNNRRLFPDRPCHTIPASFYANFVHPFMNRNFTPREGARIQSFPDWYRFYGKPTVVSQMMLAREGRSDELHLCQYNQIGNAVPPLLAFHLAKHITSLI